MKKPDPTTGTAHRIPRVKPDDFDPRVRALRSLRRKIGIAVGILVLVVLCLVFPRALAFVELAAREIRYLWWLIAILAVGVWLVFFVGKKKE